MPRKWSRLGLPRTAFVRDRAEEAGWDGRDYVYDLLRLERYIDEGVHSMAAIDLKGLRSLYPAEAQCILAELKEGRVTPASEWAARKEQAQKREDDRLAAMLAEEEAEERAFWAHLSDAILAERARGR